MYLWRKRTDSAQAAFEAQVEPCWDALWRYAYRVTGDRDEAEDLLAETLLEGYRSFGQFRGDTTFLRWMYRVMTTTRIDMVRKAKRHRSESLDTPPENDEEADSWREIAVTETDPAFIVLNSLLTEPVQRALDGLPEAYRIVLILADMEQMDYAEVSQILQIPVGTVRSRLHRARSQMRAALTAKVEQP